MLKFVSFTSGSCGNCCCLSGPEGGLLIDAGASMRGVKRAMADRGLALEDFPSILVTHDHIDHIRFLGTYCKYVFPGVYATAKLHGALSTHTYTRDHIASCRRILPAGEWTDIPGGFSVRWFEVPHDATQTVGYAVRCASVNHLFVLMTDLESVPAEAMDLAREADTVVIESNYDYDMLIHGPYPPELKNRILREGHLSNDDCAAAIREFYHPGLRNLFLCHLSANNNTPALAYESARSALERMGVDPGTVNLRTLPRGLSTPVINL